MGDTRRIDQGLILKRVAGETISALKAVYSSGSGEVMLATNQGTFEQAQVLGIALNGGVAGQPIKVLTQGAIKDAFFSFLLNAQLYLGHNGVVTQTPPVIGHRVLLAKSIDVSEIYLEIQEPIIL